MTFTPKNWIDSPSTSTPLSAAAIEDLETRVTDYADDHGPGVSVIDYGAVGNGSTDDTTAFESAATAAGVGGRVYVPPATYVVTDVAISSAHQTWEFAPGAILKLPAGATNGIILRVTGDYFTLDGGEFDGNRTNVTTTVSDAAIRVGAAHCTIRNAYVHDCDGIGILVHPNSATSGVHGTLIEDCTVVDTFFSSIIVNAKDYVGSTVVSYGVQIRGCWVNNTLASVAAGVGGWCGIQVLGKSTGQIHGVQVSSCFVRQTASTGGSPNNAGGIAFRDVVGAVAGDCTVENTDLGYTGDTWSDVSFSNCTSFGARAMGFEAGGSTTGTTITGCTADGNASAVIGIYADNATNDYLTITGNTVRNLNLTNGGIGIRSNAGGTGMTISGNMISAPGDGIDIYGASHSNLTISGNTVAMAAGGSVGVYYGIYLDPVSTGNKAISIRNNNLRDWTTRGILVDHSSSLTVSGLTIRDNVFNSTGTIVTLNNIVLDNTCRTENWGTDTVASVAGTITLPPSSDIITLTGTAAVTSITASYPGRRVTLINTSTASLTDGSNLKLSANSGNTADDTITLVCDGTNWFEVSRSVN